MAPTWSPPGSCRPQMGPMLAPWTLLSGIIWNQWLPTLPTSLTLGLNELRWRLTSCFYIFQTKFMQYATQIAVNGSHTVYYNNVTLIYTKLAFIQILSSLPGSQLTSIKHRSFAHICVLELWCCNVHAPSQRVYRLFIYREKNRLVLTSADRSEVTSLTFQIKSNQIKFIAISYRKKFCMSLTIHSLWQQHIEQ